MLNLFQSADIDKISLIDYAALFLDPSGAAYETIQLPPIQRNAVWNVGQIERLWDSVLRGFPIGSFYLSERSTSAMARSLFTGIQQQHGKKGFFLMDGQQRSRALLLGFRPTAAARLYIDLNPQLPFGNPEANDRRFIFRLLTNYQPWGMNRETPSRKLSDHEKYKGREQLGLKNLYYDYQLSINAEADNIDYLEHSPASSWPLQAHLPIPFDILVNACGGYSGNFTVPDWSALMAFVPKQFEDHCTENPTAHFGEILKGLEQTISVKAERQRHLSLLLHTTEKDLPESQLDSLEVLFTRVNSSGTTLEGEEMAYSLIKSAWDEAYTLVTKIIRDENIGYLLAPTKLVMAASRIAAIRAGYADEPKVNVVKFRRWIGESYSEQGLSFLSALKELMVTDHNDQSRFTRILALFCNLALYREAIPTDPGLPRKLILSVKPVLLHVVFFWLDQQLDEGIDFEGSRMSIIRYLLFAPLGYIEPDKASKIAVGIIKKSKAVIFPDVEIYRAALKDKQAKAVPPPHLLFAKFDEPTTGYFRGWDDLYGVGDDPYHNFRKDFWGDKNLLLWFQRASLPRWFPGYNPMSDDAADTPYDFDHILPYSHIYGQGASNQLYNNNDRQLNDTFWRRRGWYISSIGNFRVWPSWANRSDGDKCPARKLRLESDDFAADRVAGGLHFLDAASFLTASCIQPDQADRWLKSKGTPANWPEARRINWQAAVENRVLDLYGQYYHQLRLGLYTAVHLEITGELEQP